MPKIIITCTDQFYHQTDQQVTEADLSPENLQGTGQLLMRGIMESVKRDDLFKHVLRFTPPPFPVAGSR